VSEWREEVRLGDIIELKYGKDHKDLSDGDIPVYGSGGIMRYVDTFIYNKESILIPRKGSLNNVFYLSEKRPFWTVDTIFWSRINTEIVFGKFLFYCLKTVDFVNLNTGSAVLRSETAIQISINIINSFVQMRQFLTTNADIFKRLKSVESKQTSHEIKTDEQFNKVFDALENKNQLPKQGVFFNGEVFDAYALVSQFIKKAKKSIVLIDSYIDESTLIYLSKASSNVKITLLSKTVSKKLQLDIDKYNEQYQNLKVVEFNDSHDRFLILDGKEIYHIGASLKDLGKKWFAFSLLEGRNFALIDKVREVAGCE